jgi:hypothetical protein
LKLYNEKAMNKKIVWSVFNEYTFLANIEATDKEAARAKVTELLGIDCKTAERLTIFVAGDTVTVIVARNTFILFQQFGGCTLDFTEYHCSRPISLEECQLVIKTMTAWVATQNASIMAARVGSDLDYVMEQVKQLEDILIEPRWSNCTWFIFSPGHDNSRERERDDALADAYCDALYTSSPYDE